jgi:hypothetical protein
MTEAEIDRREKVMDAMREGGASEDELRAYAVGVWKPDETPVPDTEEPSGLAGERRRVVKPATRS